MQRVLTGKQLQRPHCTRDLFHCLEELHVEEVWQQIQRDMMRSTCTNGILSELATRFFDDVRPAFFESVGEFLTWPQPLLFISIRCPKPHVAAVWQKSLEKAVPFSKQTHFSLQIRYTFDVWDPRSTPSLSHQCQNKKFSPMLPHYKTNGQRNA